MTPAELVGRFAPVLSAPARALFARLVGAATEITVDDEGNVACVMPGDAGAWVIWPALSTLQVPPAARAEHRQRLARIAKHAPAPFRAFLDVCGGMVWGEVGNTGQVTLDAGFDGSLHALGELPDDFGFAYTPELFAPISIDSGDYYVRHPKTGALIFQTEGCAQTVQGTDDVVEIYLRELWWKIAKQVPALAGAKHREAWLSEIAPDDGDDDDDDAAAAAEPAPAKKPAAKKHVAPTTKRGRFTRG